MPANDFPNGYNPKAKYKTVPPDADPFGFKNNPNRPTTAPPVSPTAEAAAPLKDPAAAAAKFKDPFVGPQRPSLAPDNSFRLSGGSISGAVEDMQRFVNTTKSNVGRAGAAIATGVSPETINNWGSKTAAQVNRLLTGKQNFLQDIAKSGFAAAAKMGEGGIGGKIAGAGTKVLSAAPALVGGAVQFVGKNAPWVAAASDGWQAAKSFSDGDYAKAGMNAANTALDIGARFNPVAAFARLGTFVGEEVNERFIKPDSHLSNQVGGLANALVRGTGQLFGQDWGTDMSPEEADDFDAEVKAARPATTPQAPTPLYATVTTKTLPANAPKTYTLPNASDFRAAGPAQTAQYAQAEDAPMEGRRAGVAAQFGVGKGQVTPMEINGTTVFKVGKNSFTDGSTPMKRGGMVVSSPAGGGGWGGAGTSLTEQAGPRGSSTAITLPDGTVVDPTADANNARYRPQSTALMNTYDGGKDNRMTRAIEAQMAKLENSGLAKISPGHYYRAMEGLLGQLNGAVNEQGQNSRYAMGDTTNRAQLGEQGRQADATLDYNRSRDSAQGLREAAKLQFDNYKAQMDAQKDARDFKYKAGLDAATAQRADAQLEINRRTMENNAARTSSDMEDRSVKALRDTVAAFTTDPATGKPNEVATQYMMNQLPGLIADQGWTTSDGRGGQVPLDFTNLSQPQQQFIMKAIENSQVANRYNEDLGVVDWLQGREELPTELRKSARYTPTGKETSNRMWGTSQETNQGRVNQDKYNKAVKAAREGTR